MKNKHLRILKIFISLTLISIAAIFLLINFKDNIVFFYTPSEIQINNTEKIRIGGVVKDNSVLKNELNVKFIITDFKNEIAVNYTGLLPNLFREGQGVVATGVIKDEVFYAEEILAKHDENYMPKNVYEEIKKNYNYEKK